MEYFLVHNFSYLYMCVCVCVCVCVCMRERERREREGGRGESKWSISFYTILCQHKIRLPFQINTWFFLLSRPTNALYIHIY